jgi:bifunctional non-homologous end joining protein LigD
MSLAEYHLKRDFSKTPERRGETARDGKPLLRFVVQKHAAWRLHYDFRLEVNAFSRVGPCRKDQASIQG